MLCHDATEKRNVDEDGSETSEGCSLTELHLSSCQLNDDCLRALSSGLAHHHHQHGFRGERRCRLSRLRTLDIGGTQHFSEECIANVFLPSLLSQQQENPSQLSSIVTNDGATTEPFMTTPLPKGIIITTNLENLSLPVKNFASRRLLRFISDVNKTGGRRYLPLQTNDDNEGIPKTQRDVRLWPYIFYHRVCSHQNTAKFWSSPATFLTPEEERLRRNRGKQAQTAMITIINGRDGRRLRPQRRQPPIPIDDMIDFDNAHIHIISNKSVNGNSGNSNKNDVFIETMDIRRASVLYYLLLHGALLECCTYTTTGGISDVTKSNTMAVLLVMDNSMETTAIMKEEGTRNKTDGRNDMNDRIENNIPNKKRRQK